MYDGKNGMNRKETLGMLNNSHINGSVLCLFNVDLKILNKIQ